MSDIKFSLYYVALSLRSLPPKASEPFRRVGSLVESNKISQTLVKKSCEIFPYVKSLSFKKQDHIYYFANVLRE